LLDRIGGIREKCLEIINPERRNPDPGLFEILTALMYARNGWPTVDFIPRSRKDKSPDLRVSDAVPGGSAVFRSVALVPARIGCPPRAALPVAAARPSAADFPFDDGDV
jgi:hypothetical protein